MVKVTVITAGGRKTDNFDEAMTPKEILEALDVDYSAATNSLDGARLDTRGMNTSLRELGVGETARMTSIVKIDNAANITLAGSAAVVTSAVSLEDLKRVEKFAPEALKIVDEEGETVFKVCTRENSSGSINKYGVVFGSVVNHEGKATVTVVIDPEIEDKREAVKDMMGAAILDLNTIEKELPEVLKDIAEKEKEIEGCIEQK